MKPKLIIAGIIFMVFFAGVPTWASHSDRVLGRAGRWEAVLSQDDFTDKFSCSLFYVSGTEQLYPQVWVNQGQMHIAFAFGGKTLWVEWRTDNGPIRERWVKAPVGTTNRIVIFDIREYRLLNQKRLRVRNRVSGEIADIDLANLAEALKFVENPECVTPRK